VERILGERVAVLFVTGECQEIDQTVAHIGRPGKICGEPIADDLATGIANGLELVLHIVSEVLHTVRIQRVSDTEGVHGHLS
jgi:hypothetical protein